jgi:hypothetical protein
MSRSTSRLRDGLTSLAITLVLLTIVNFLLVYFSPRVFTQPDFPRSFLNHIDPCYHMFYHDTHGATFKNWVAVVGDSYAAGSGDEFLGGKRDYGIFPKFRSRTGGNYFIFARAGFGSINAAKELKLCMSMFNDSFLLPHFEKPKELLFVFYEGNDLNNNVDHLRRNKSGEPIELFVQKQISHPDNEWRRRMELRLPLYDLLWGAFWDLCRSGWGGVKSSWQKAGGDTHDRGHGEVSRAAESRGASMTPGLMHRNHAIIGHQLRPVRGYPQSAAAELAGHLDVPLQVFYESALALNRYLPDTPINIIYLPSVVTTYAWQDPIQVHAYHTKSPVFTTTRDNEIQSRYIRKSIAEFAGRNHFGFIDPTATLQSAAQTRSIHGPRDWKHFNAIGNWIIADTLARLPDSATTPDAVPAGTGPR